MNSTIRIALIAFLPAVLLFSASWLQFSKLKTAALLMQLAGTAALLIVVLVHLCEGFGLVPWIGWGGNRTIGHYLDLAAAVIGLTLFPLGYLLDALSRARTLSE